MGKTGPRPLTKRKSVYAAILGCERLKQKVVKPHTGPSAIFIKDYLVFLLLLVFGILPVFWVLLDSIRTRQAPFYSRGGLFKFRETRATCGALLPPATWWLQQVLSWTAVRAGEGRITNPWPRSWKFTGVEVFQFCDWAATPAFKLIGVKRFFLHRIWVWIIDTWCLSMSKMGIKGQFKYYMQQKREDFYSGNGRNSLGLPFTFLTSLDIMY